MRDGYYLIKRAVRKPDGKTRQQLACDYAHTFLAAGNYEERMATPYESVFTSEDGLLMQDARDDVYRLYCQEHVGVSVGYTDPEDHVSFEMEFMAALADKCNAALDAGDMAEACRLADVAADFHARHLENWIDDLCDTIDKVADTKFYRGVSKLTRGYVHADAEAVADVADALAEAKDATVHASRAATSSTSAGCAVRAASSIDCAAASHAHENVLAEA